MGLTLLAVILWLPNPYPAEMLIEPATPTAVAETPVVEYVPTPFAPGDDHSAGLEHIGRDASGNDLWLPNPIPTGAHLSELEMSNLIDHWFPPDLHDWALRVSKCESRWYTTAKNPRTSAAGLFQFKRSTWDWVAEHTGTASYDAGGVWEAHSQAINAAWLVQNEGPQHWVCK